MIHDLRHPLKHAFSQP